jgi:hypothetical protein
MLNNILKTSNCDDSSSLLSDGFDPEAEELFCD